jgi:hypothetical protein
MANLPTHLTEKQIADFPWLNSNEPAIAARLDVTGHPAEDIFKFQAALNESGIVTKLHSTNSTTYVVANNESESILSKIRLKHLPLVDGNGLRVDSYRQFNSNTPLQRADSLFADLSPNAKAGTRVENPAALESLQKVFHRLGYYGNGIKGGILEILASGPNAQLLEEVGAIKSPFNFTTPPAIKVSVAHTEIPPTTGIANNFIQQNRLSLGLGLGAAIITADAALAAEPALSKGEYADAALLAVNSSARLAAEITVASECTAEVAAAAIPLSPSGLGYAGAVIGGAAACAIGSHYTMTSGENAAAVAAIIEERVKEVAANNGLDPDHIWASMLEKVQGEQAKSAEVQPSHEP